MRFGSFDSGAMLARFVFASLTKGSADVAQLVEHSLGKGEVIGSIPIISSRFCSKAVG
jgi:hypothetical protein